VSFDVVNLMPGNYVTSHHVRYDESVPYTDPIPGTGESPATEHTLPGTRCDDTEVYLNHNLMGARTLLLGLEYRDPVTGKVYMQNTAGWFMDAGKGFVFYFMAGHRAEAFKNQAYAQILINAVEYHP
jgi:hypothetical protein